jgi:hypothetical protein
MTGNRTGIYVIATSILLFTPPFVAASDEMTEILANVRTSEDLYSSIEFMCRMNYRLVHGIEKIDKGNVAIITSTAATSHYVYQKHMQYFKIDSVSQLFDKSNKSARAVIYGYDGEKTRCIEDMIANEHDTYKEHPLAIFPHTVILSRSNVHFRLYDYLSGGQNAKTHPYYKDLKLRSAFDGRERLGGLDCVRIKTQTWSNEAKPEAGDLTQLWLAVDRNYLPVQSMVFRMRLSKDYPVAVGRIERMEEVAPGIWFPKKVDIHVFPETRQRPSENVTEYEFSDVSLYPNYDMHLFRNIKSSTAIISYKLKNGKIVASEILQNPKKTPIISRLMALFTPLVVVLAVLFWRKMRRPTGGLMPSLRATEKPSQ